MTFEKTDWFPVGVNPVFKGFYQRRILTSHGNVIELPDLCFWTGVGWLYECWGNGSDSALPNTMYTEGGFECEWRGMKPRWHIEESFISQAS